MAITHYDWKYGDIDWRSEEIETFQNDLQTLTKFTVVDGEIVETVEETLEFFDPVAGKAVNPAVGPPYHFADNSSRRDVAYSMMPTRRIRTTYDEISEDSYRVTTHSRDMQTGEFTRTVQIQTGKRPAAPTKQSGLTALRQQPVIATILDFDAFTKKKMAVNLPWAQDHGDIHKAAHRIIERNSAITYSYDCAYDPRIRVGQTGLVKIAERGINGYMIVVGIQTHIGAKGDAKMTLTVEYWKQR